eukprot:CAMPEP_0198330946 /NCGR_PEP_ID=MMETSP1450-20131203/17249_1 /TAXON_ID=753684 ORGANISM="Madagascaria erythrocladiodes, Strain CCMP3234" /NCGR_SAMPLE_ID=MMETSP1450 /ASSEMBLY_ACC=CAM_ASM_001115 /LENGTH=207 /DNA_ID=CAMNT_0044035281 /DNA_START=593 /DNA_END=1217 /DNA_ORIENTATION=-
MWWQIGLWIVPIRVVPLHKHQTAICRDVHLSVPLLRSDLFGRQLLKVVDWSKEVPPITPTFILPGIEEMEEPGIERFSVKVAPGLADALTDYANGLAPMVITPQTERDAAIIDAIRAEERAETDMLGKEICIGRAARADDLEKAATAAIDSKVASLEKVMVQRRQATNEPRCAAERRQCLDCYRGANSDPLKCLGVTEAFSRCVRRM